MSRLFTVRWVSDEDLCFESLGRGWIDWMFVNFYRF